MILMNLFEFLVFAAVTTSILWFGLMYVWDRLEFSLLRIHTELEASSKEVINAEIVSKEWLLALPTVKLRRYGFAIALLAFFLYASFRSIILLLGDFWSLGLWDLVSTTLTAAVSSLSILFALDFVIQNAHCFLGLHKNKAIREVILSSAGFVVLMLIALVIWGAYRQAMFEAVSNPPKEWGAGDAQHISVGTYGDMYGGLNALFSGLAFAGVIYTILLQMTELRLQRKEMEASRKATQDVAASAQKSRVDKAIELFDSFRAGRMRKARDGAWVFRNEWMGNEEFRNKVVKEWFFNIGAHSYDFTTPEILDGKSSRLSHGYIHDEVIKDFNDKEKALYRGWADTFDLLEFFGMLGVHEGNEREIQTLDFYYYWWRGLLVTLARSYDLAYEEKFGEKVKEHFPKPNHYKKLMLFEEKLGIKVKYDRTMHPLDNETWNGEDVKMPTA